MDNLYDAPLPAAYDAVADDPSVKLPVTELDWLLNQVEGLRYECPDAAGEALQAVLLAKRLSPIQHLMTQLQARAACYQHAIQADNLPAYLQTDLIAPMLNALSSHFKRYADPKCFALGLQRDSQYIQAQLQTDTQAVGECVTLAYQYALEDALLVEHQHQVYAISPHQLVQVVRIPGTARQQDNTLAYAGTIYQLREWLTLFIPEQTGSARPLPDKINALLTPMQDAVYVDQIIGYCRRLIRPIHLPLHPLSWLSGGSLLPDRRIALHIELSRLPGYDQVT